MEENKGNWGYKGLELTLDIEDDRPLLFFFLNNQDIKFDNTVTLF